MPERIQYIFPALPALIHVPSVSNRDFQGGPIYHQQGSGNKFDEEKDEFLFNISLHD
jgi:hypothetical protein